MSTRVLREKVKAQQEELIGLYQENAKLKVLIATDYHELSNGERESMIAMLTKMNEKPNLKFSHLKSQALRNVPDNSFLSSPPKLMNDLSVPSKDRMLK